MSIRNTFICEVSVVIATYNGEKYIDAQLSSILQQLGEKDEIIICDDVSADNTVGIIQKFNDSRIKLFENNKTLGHIKNFEKALAITNGKYIFFSDQDDIWLSNKVSVCVSYLEKYDAIVTDAFIVDKDLNVVYESQFKLTGSKKGFFKNALKNSYMGCCMAIKKEVLNIALPFPADIPMHDMWIGFVAEAFYKTAFIKEKLILHRRHFNNSSPMPAASPFNFIKQFGFRINIIKYFPLILKRKFFN